MPGQCHAKDSELSVAIPQPGNKPQRRVRYRTMAGFESAATVDAAALLLWPRLLFIDVAAYLLEALQHLLA